jgi:hypothetical protein
VLARYTIFIILAYFLFKVVLGQVGLAPLYLPVALLLACLAASALAPILLVGRAVADLRNAMRLLGAALFLAGLAWNLLPSGSHEQWLVTAMLVVGGSSLAAVMAARLLAKAYYVVLRAAVLAVLAIMSALLSVLIGQGSLDLGMVGFLAFTLSAVLSLLALFHRHGNPLLRALGQYFRSNQNVLLTTLLIVIVFEYAVVLRPLLAQRVPDAVVLVEWAFVALAGAYAAFTYHSYLKRVSQARLMGDWRKLSQTLTFTKGEMQEVERAVQGFVELGEKESLVVTLTAVMMENGIPKERIGPLLTSILRYHEEEVPAMLRWAYGDHQAWRRQERVQVIARSLAGAAEALDARHLKRSISELES